MNKVLLIRDDLNDIGQTPSRGSYCSSPDLIVHTQVANPQTFFTQNYAQDVNERLKTGSASNFIYTRCKNMSKQPKQAFFHLYASTSSLFMTPSIWKKNLIKSHDGKEYVSSDLIQPNQIGVGKIPFVFDAKGSHNYCHVGYVTDAADKQPDIPDSFPSYDAFCVWIKSNTHICLRNFRIFSTTSPSYEQTDYFANPSTEEERLITIKVELTGSFPRGTTATVICEPMSINYIYDVHPESRLNKFATSGFAAAGFEGFIQTIIQMPTGSVWPSDAQLAVSTYVGINADSIAIQYAEPVQQTLEGIDMASNALLQPQGRLIHIGTCTSRIISQ